MRSKYRNCDAFSSHHLQYENRLEIGPRSTPMLSLLNFQYGIVHPRRQLPPPEARPEVLKQSRQLPILVPLVEVHPPKVRPGGRLHRRAPTPLLRPDDLWRRTLGHGWLHESRADAEVVEPLCREREGGHERHRLERCLEQWGGAW